MKRQIKTWAKRVVATVLLLAALLLLLILNPILTYANKTSYCNFDVYHNQAVNPTFYTKLDKANQLLTLSEFYHPNLHFDVCLNDGSVYPVLIRGMRGQAFAWGFYNKVVLQGTINYQNNYVEYNGYKWNLTELLAHEMTHCLQFDKLGLWRSNPVASIPAWKWEGYAEYIARQNGEQKHLEKNIDLLSEINRKSWGIVLADSTIAPRKYVNYWTLVQYCMDIRKMSYQQILMDTASEENVKQAMMNWYGQNKKESTTSVGVR